MGASKALIVAFIVEVSSVQLGGIVGRILHVAFSKFTNVNYFINYFGHKF